MAGALGFATAENIEYVFGSTTSPIPGVSLVEGELLVLLARVLMPIHVICSVLQARNLSKVRTVHTISSLHSFSIVNFIVFLSLIVAYFFYFFFFVSVLTVQRV